MREKKAYLKPIFLMNYKYLSPVHKMYLKEKFVGFYQEANTRVNESPSPVI